jgi:predicted nuclease of predicted toxin-antitoxin system
MRFLADENFPGSAVRCLSAGNHDVVWVRTERPGSSDSDVLDWAAREKRILLTFDKDFGELAYRSGLPVSSGVVLFRIAMPSASDAGEKIAARVTERSDWAGHFSVIEPARVRMRPLAET